MIKDTAIYIFIVLLSVMLLLVACEKGQSRVDAWEYKTGRYGEGLR